jgi:Cdc6-like AAA superfamily ATPase
MAELLRQQPKVKHVEINCMTLPKRTLVGALTRIAELCAGIGCARSLQGRSGKSLAFAAMTQIAKVDAPVVIVLDEIDQLVQKSTGSTGAECPLETLFTLPLIPCKHPIAVVAIANAVDLLQRRSVPVVAQSLAQSLIFEPYTASELRAIFEARLSTYEHRGSLEKDLGKVGIELRVREVAKNSGDCRRLLSLFSQAVIEDDIMRGAPPTLMDKSEDMDAEPVVKKAAATVPRNQYDPIDTIKHLPVEQQVLLGALAGARSEAIPLSEATSRYKALCLRLHQPLDLARKALLNTALQALGSRGLLDMRTTRRSSDPVASLAVSRKALSEALSKANPLLGQFLQE